MTNRLTALAGVSLLAISLTACGGSKSSDSAEPSGSDFVETPSQSASVSGGFDSPVTTADGLSFTLAAPKQFKPGDFATGLVQGQLNEGFDIEVKNGGSADADLSTVIVAATTSAGACTDIFDGDNGVNGAPMDPIKAGGDVKFAWALSCPGKVGDDLSITLSNQGAPVIEITGKLA